MTLSTHKEKMRELLARKSEVINDSLWYVNPTNIDQVIEETLRFAAKHVVPEYGKTDTSIYTHCWDCKTWGVCFPEDKDCGNCGSKNTTEYWPDARSHAQEKFKELLTDTK